MVDIIFAVATTKGIAVILKNFIVSLPRFSKHMKRVII